MNVPDGTESSETPAPSPDPTPTPNPAPSPTPELNEDGTPKSLVEAPKPEAPTEFVPLVATDITFPEGFEVNETLRDEALAIINNRELSAKDQLQGLVNLQVKMSQEASEAASETWTTLQKTWQDEVKADPTIGGDKLATTLGAVNKLVTEYGSKELLDVFASTGAGNNVHVIKFLNTVAGHLNEGKPVTGQPSGVETTAAQRMFPSMKG